MTCDRCYRPADSGEHGLYLCPLEARRDAPVVFADDIPGGLDIEHGLCDPSGTPKRYYSRSAIRRAAQEKGLVPWTEVYTEDRTKDARVRSDWQQSSEAQRARRDRHERRMDGERVSATQPPPQRAPSESTKRIAADVVRAMR